MKIKLGVLFGGKSVEHEISIISAIQAIGYIDKEKYDVVPIYITKNNEFYVGDDIDKIESYTKLNALLADSQRVIMVPNSNRVDLVRYPFKRFGNNVVDYIDIAFPVVHGTNVEDGTLQGYLKMMNIPYVGCDVISSAVGMDKYVMKTVLKDVGIPVLDCKVFTSKQYDADKDSVISIIENEVSKYPVIVKPINLGSSIGITKADDRQELEDALQTAFSYSSKVLVEEAVQNLKEINCAVLGDYEHAQASECEEPVNSGEILDFQQKYIGDGNGSAKGGAKSGGAKTAGAKSGGSEGMATLKRKIPAEITPEQKALIQDYAVKAFKALGCSGVSRIDFMMNSATGQIWLNEINTIPGSLSFYLWEPIGKSFKELLNDMIATAMKRERENSNITYAFDSNVLQGVSLGGAKGTKGAKGAKR